MTTLPSLTESAADTIRRQAAELTALRRGIAAEVREAARQAYGVRTSDSYGAGRAEQARDQHERLLRLLATADDATGHSLAYRLDVLERLVPLCPCPTSPGDPNYGPQQECPIHGDGETFVGGVRALLELRTTARTAIPTNDPEASLPLRFDAVRGALADEKTWWL